MSRDRARSRLFKGDPSMLLLGDGLEPVSHAERPAPPRPTVPRPAGVRLPAVEVPGRAAGPPTIRVHANPAPRADTGFVVERITGDVLTPTETVFDAGYDPAGTAAGDAEPGSPLRIFLGGPAASSEAVAPAGRVWDASALADPEPEWDDDESDEILAVGDWTPEGATEVVEPAAPLMEARLPPMDVGWAAPAPAPAPALEPWDAPPRPAWAEDTSEAATLPRDDGPIPGRMDGPQWGERGDAAADIPPPWERGSRGRLDQQSPLRPLDKEDTSEQVRADAIDRHQLEAQGSDGRPVWAREPLAEDPPPPALHLGGTSRLERELGQHWDADEQALFDEFNEPEPPDAAVRGAGVREPWDVTVTGARRRPAHLAPGEHQRPARSVPEFRPLDEEPEASGWVKIAVAVLVVLVISAVVVEVGSNGSGSGGGDPLSVLQQTWLQPAVAPVAPAPAEAEGAEGPKPSASPGPDGTDSVVPDAAAGPVAGAPPGADATAPEPAAESPKTPEQARERAAADARAAAAAEVRAEAEARERAAARVAAAAEAREVRSRELDASLPAWEETGLLRIKTAFKATVYVDGKRLGRTPIEPIEVSTGMHDVRVVPLGGGRVRTTRARVDPGRASEVSFGR